MVPSLCLAAGLQHSLWVRKGLRVLAFSNTANTSRLASSPLQSVIRCNHPWSMRAESYSSVLFNLPGAG